MSGVVVDMVSKAKRVAAAKADRERERAFKREKLVYRPGELHEVTREAKLRLVDLGGVYQRGGKMAKIVQQRVKSELVGDVITPAIVELQASTLCTLLSAAAEWVSEKTDKKGEVHTYAINPPDCVTRALVQDHLNADDPLPDLSGLAHAPFLRRDGSVVQANRAHYDDASGLYIDPLGSTFLPVIDARCTKADALSALDRLGEVISGYEVEDELSRAVALAALLTPFTRTSLPMVPGFAIDAPKAGSGKTKLACLPGILATGKVPPTVAAGQGPDEQDKQFNASLLGGRPFIILDNITDAKWGTGLLNSTLTSERVEVRPFGTSSLRELPNTATVIITGNNLAYPGDVGRRFLACRITPSSIDPTSTRFDFDPVDFALEHRAELVHAALTILRAYVLSGRPTQRGKPMASYERFASIVRDALLWLGLPDLADALAKNTAGAEDDDRGSLDRVIDAWARHPVLSTGEYTAAQVFERASTYGSVLQNALTAGCEGGEWSVAKVGTWLRSHKDQWSISGRRVKAGKKTKVGTLWFLDAKSTATPVVPFEPSRGEFE